jgi:hypothetical protein
MSTENPHYRIVMAVDMESSTRRTNPAKKLLRRAMYDAVEHTLHASRITEEHRDPFIDCGDGILMLLHPRDHVAKTRLLDTVMPQLHTRLTDYGCLHPEDPLRLRAVIHAGDIHYDQRGCYGETLDIAFRLLDAPQVKSHLRHSTLPLAFVVSDDIYLSTIRHGYPGITESEYRNTVRVRVGGRTHQGWVHQGALSDIPVP